MSKFTNSKKINFKEFQKLRNSNKQRNSQENILKIIKKSKEKSRKSENNMKIIFFNKMKTIHLLKKIGKKNISIIKEGKN